MATSTWAWLGLVDAITGEPFRTFNVLGGIALFTMMHYLLNIAYGVSMVALIHGAARESSLILAATFGLVMVEIGFVMATVMLSQFLGGVAWVGIFGGSMIGAVIAFVILSRSHPLAARLREAEAQR